MITDEHMCAFSIDTRTSVHILLLCNKEQMFPIKEKKRAVIAMDANKRIKSRRRRLAHTRVLKSKRRVQTIFGILALCGTIGISGLLGNDLFADKATAANETVNIMVTAQAGDSLWSIASDHIEKGKSVRSYVYEIADLNSIDDNKIYTGQTILVPVMKS